MLLLLGIEALELPCAIAELLLSAPGLLHDENVVLYLAVRSSNAVRTIFPEKALKGWGLKSIKRDHRPWQMKGIQRFPAESDIVYDEVSLGLLRG